MYSSVTNEVEKTISRFEEVAYSGCFRHDGQLLAAGSEGGVVKVKGIFLSLSYLFNLSSSFSFFFLPPLLSAPPSPSSPVSSSLVDI